MGNFDKKDGAYTGDPDKLFITFLPDSCEFFDENGNPITALDITVGSKVKMTSSTGLKTNAEGYTTVEIKKVEVLEAAPSADDLNNSGGLFRGLLVKQSPFFILAEDSPTQCESD